MKDADVINLAEYKKDHGIIDLPRTIIYSEDLIEAMQLLVQQLRSNETLKQIS